MATVNHEQAASRAEWLAERRTVIGASDAPAVLGMRPSRLALFLEKTGRLPEGSSPQTKAMKRGLRLEKYIVEVWNEDLMPDDPIVETQRFVRSPEMPWAGATLDGICRSGIHVEFKTSGSFGPVRRIGGPDDFESLPDAWAAQGAHQLMVTGGDRMYFAVVLPDLDVHTVGPWPRPDGLIRLVSEEISRFWHENVLAGIPPEEYAPEDAEHVARVFRRDTGEILSLGMDVGDAAIAYHTLGRQIRELEDLRAAEKARLLMALGNSAGADLPGGWSISRKVVTVNFKPREASTSQQIRITVKEPQS